MGKKNKKSRLRLLILGGVVIAALLLGWCGRGYFGGGKSGDEHATKDKAKIRPAVAVPVDAGLTRCRVRVDSKGVHLNGAAVAIDELVATCKKTGEAELVVTGDAKFGAVEELQTKLGAAGVRIYSAAGPR